MLDVGRDLSSPWMIDETGRWQPPAHRTVNRARVAESGWVWIGPSDTPSAGPDTVRLCFRPSVVDAIAIGRAVDWLGGLARERPVELLLIEDGRDIERFSSPGEAIDRCIAVSSALAEIRIVDFRSDLLEATDILRMPDFQAQWQRVYRIKPKESGPDDAVMLARDDAQGLTCVLTWIGDQVTFAHIGAAVAYRSVKARTAWIGRPVRELGEYDASSAEIFDDVIRFGKPLLHRLEVTLQRGHDDPTPVAYNRLLMLYPTPPDARPVAISYMRPA